MGPIWGRQDPGAPHIGPMNFTIWELDKVCIFAFLASKCRGVCNITPISLWKGAIEYSYIKTDCEIHLLLENRHDFKLQSGLINCI